MLKNLLAAIKEENLTEQLYHSLIGVEIEEHRVDKNGKLSQTEYPKDLASRSYHPYLQTDFAETQHEIISDPSPYISGVLDQLDNLQTVLNRSIQKDEYIWPLSMPPALSEDDKRYIKDHFGRPAYAKYRNYLTKKYGIKRKIITGVHINFSMPEPVINRLHRHYKSQYANLIEFKNDLYFQIAQNFVLNRWLITYLFGASPIAEKGFFNEQTAKQFTHPVRSIRSGKYGYNNFPQDGVGPEAYTSIDAYVSEINQAIQTKKLYGLAEFYGPVRLRGQDNIEEYKTNGIRYLEFRTFDNTPFTPNGFSRHALYFLKFFFIYLMVSSVDQTDIKDKLFQAFADNNRVAAEDPVSPTFKQDAGIKIFENLIDMSVSLNAHSEQLSALDDFSEIITHPEITASAMLEEKIKNNSLMDYGMQVSKRWKQNRSDEKAILPTLEKLPLKAQKLIYRAIQLGIRYYVVNDENGSALITLTFNNVTQVVFSDKISDKNPTQILLEMFPELKRM